MRYRMNEYAEALSTLHSDYTQSGVVMGEVQLEMETMQKSPEYQEYLREAEEYNKSILQLQSQLIQVRKYLWSGVLIAHMIDIFQDTLSKPTVSSESPSHQKSRCVPEESDDDNWGLTDSDSDGPMSE